MTTSRRRFILGALGTCALAAMGAVALAGIGRGRAKPDTGPFGWPHLQTIKEKLDLSHDQAEALLRIYNRYEHDQKENNQSSKTGDKNSQAGSDSDLKSQALSEIRKALGDAMFKRFEELVSGGKKKK